MSLVSAGSCRSCVRVVSELSYTRPSPPNIDLHQAREGRVSVLDSDWSRTANLSSHWSLGSASDLAAPSLIGQLTYKSQEVGQ